MTSPIARRAAVVLVVVNVLCGLWLHDVLTRPDTPLPPQPWCISWSERLPGVVYPLGYALHCDPDKPIWEVPYRATTAPPVTR